MPPQAEQAGPRSRPTSLAGMTGGESVIAEAAATVFAGWAGLGLNFLDGNVTTLWLNHFGPENATGTRNLSNRLVDGSMRPALGTLASRRGPVLYVAARRIHRPPRARPSSTTSGASRSATTG